MTDRPLASLGVVVTRPEPDGEALARRLKDAGATVWPLPALRIAAKTPEEERLAGARASLESALFVFVSRNAVRYGLPALGGRPARALAVGPSTAEELAAAGVALLAESAGYDSEALLRLDLLAEPLDEDIWIVRGEGGRALLGDTLADRGARVTYLEVYRRLAPDPDPAVLAETLAAWRNGGIGAVTATSIEILDNLRNLLGSQYADLLSGTPLVTASERVVQRAAETGHRAECIIADAPGDAGLVSALAEWYGHGSMRTGSAAMNENKNGQEDSGPDDHREDPAPVEDAPPADTPPAAEPGSTSGGGTGLAATALVVALAGAGASAFHWWQGQGLDDAAVSEIARLEGSVKRVDSGLQDLDGRLTSLQRSADAASRRIDNLQGSVRDDLARLNARERALETRLAAVASRDPAAEPPVGPLLAETEYLLRVAARSVSLAGRPDVAAAALQAADRNLAELDDPRLEPVREQIADDLTAISGANKPDTAGVAMRLGSLANKVESLPLNPSLAREGTDFGQAVEQADAASGWDRLVGKVRAFFSDLFRVRAVEGDLRPGLSADEAFFLYRNLELDLKTARLAALSEDTAGYRESLRAARANLERYFDTSNPAVEGALKTLSELEGVGVETEMPDVSGSLAAFQAVDIEGGPDSRGGTGNQPVSAPPGPGDMPPASAGPSDPAEQGVEPAPEEAAPEDSETADAGLPGQSNDTGGEPPDSEPRDAPAAAEADPAPAGDAGAEADAGGPPPENSGTDTEEDAGDSDKVPGSGEAGSEGPADEEDLPEDDEAEQQAQAVGLTPEPGRP